MTETCGKLGDLSWALSDWSFISNPSLVPPSARSTTECSLCLKKLLLVVSSSCLTSILSNYDFWTFYWCLAKSEFFDAKSYFSNYFLASFSFYAIFCLCFFPAFLRPISVFFIYGEGASSRIGLSNFRLDPSSCKKTLCIFGFFKNVWVECLSSYSILSLEWLDLKSRSFTILNFTIPLLPPIGTIFFDGNFPGPVKTLSLD